MEYEAYPIGASVAITTSINQNLCKLSLFSHRASLCAVQTVYKNNKEVHNEQSLDFTYLFAIDVIQFILKMRIDSHDSAM